MNCKKEEHIIISNAQFYTSINEISQTVFKDLGCNNDVYLNLKYLIALEKNNPQITFYYTVLFNEQCQPIAFTTIQIINFYLDSIKNELELLIRKVKNIGRNLGVLSSKKPFKVLTCGNTFVSGEHGLFIKKNEDKKRVIKELVKEILHFVNSNTPLKKEISAFMLKDFTQESLFISDALLDYNYYAFNVDPNMVLHLDKNWQSFEDYLHAMKTKFRVKARKALKVSADLQVKEITLKNIDNLLPEMTNLYEKVSSKAGFNLSNFNLNTYKSLKENLGDAYLLKAYFLNNQLVGFLSGVINQKELDAHFVGIDYTKNKTYAIYQRMLYDYVQIALNKQLTTINFGRTASEIKSSVGAIPQNLTIYLRHKQSIPNRLLRVFLNKIKPTPFQQKKPFKKL